MTPERERLVRAVEEAMSNLRRVERWPDYSIAVCQAVKAEQRASDALAAYDAAHPEEAK